MSQASLLVLMDCDEALAAVQRAQRDHLPGCELHAARTAAELLQMAGNRRFDAAVVSVSAASSLDLSRQLADRFRGTGTILVLLLSPPGDSSLRTRAADAGADVVLGQPACDADLAAILQLIVRLGQQTGERQRVEDVLHETLAGAQQRETAEQSARQHHSRVAQVARLSTMGEMGTAIAHELNQPLCAILTTAQATLRLLKTAGIENRPVCDAVEQISQQAKRAGEIVRQLRDFSRRRAVHRSTIDMSEVIQMAVQFVDVEARPQSVEFVLDLPDSVPPLVGDTIQIEQVLINLIRNGIDAMESKPAGQRRLEIGLQLLPNSTLEVSLRDHGRGIPGDMLERVFDPFFSTKADGLGIGLAISRSIIEAHGGRLWAQPAPDEGVVFRFTLPLSGNSLSRR